MLLRVVDVVLSAFGLVVTLPVLVILYLLGLLDTGSPLFYQIRVGRNQVPFTIIKFRTMRTDTVSVATHLTDASAVTRFGAFLRKSKLDELPQLWNVLKGDMSLVGPRPCLFNQQGLIRERETRNVFAVRPGITGLAQIYNIDMSTPELLAKTDQQLVETMNARLYFKYLVLTTAGRGTGDVIKDKPAD